MTVKHGYHPMHPPRKGVSQSRMAEILAKNTHSKGEPPQKQPEAPAEPPIVEWEPHEPMSRFLKSKCGRYQIRKWSGAEALTGPPRYRYQAEYLVPDLWWYAFRQIRASAAECKADCEEHARGMRK